MLGCTCCPAASPLGSRAPRSPLVTALHPVRLQGLPATVTSLLTLTALRLRDRNVLIKRTDIIENLGVATIIARSVARNSSHRAGGVACQGTLGGACTCD